MINNIINMTSRPMTSRLQQAKSVDPNIRRKERAIAQRIGQANEVAQAMELAGVPDISTPEGQIAYARSQIAAAKAPAMSLTEQLYKRKRTGVSMSRKEREARRQVGVQAKQQLAQVSQTETQYEFDVAKYNPEQAKPEYKAQVLQQAKSTISNRANDLRTRIQNYKDKIQQYQSKKNGRNNSDRINDYEDRIDIANAELRVYENYLGSNENTLIKDFFLGNIENKAQYEANRREGKIEDRKAFEKAKSTPEFKQTIEILDLPPTVTSAQLYSAIEKYNRNVDVQNKLSQDKYNQQLKEQGISKIYDKPLDAWYDPTTGKEILQSVAPDTAKKLGYLPIQLTGETKTGGYLVESGTGLLTPSQLAQKSFYEKIYKTSSEIPTSFVLGGAAPTAINLKDLMSKKSPYELAQSAKPYAGKQAEMIEQQRIGDLEFLKKYGYQYVDGTKVSAGTIVPVTPSDITKLVSAPKAIATLGISNVGAYVFRKPIIKGVEKIYESTYQPTSKIGRFTKASITGATIAGLAPIVGTAYGYDIAEKSIKAAPSFVENPVPYLTKGYKYVKTDWPELAGFMVGGPLITRGLGMAEVKIRGRGGREVTTQKVNIPNYGEVIIQNVPKYGEVVWVKGAFEATEKVNVMKQINNLLGNKKRIYVSTTPQGIPIKTFSNRAGAGFEVAQVSNPLRGLYEAPPWEFLKKAGLPESGAASYYSNLARERLFPSPMDIVDVLTGQAKYGRQRPFEYLRKTYKETKIPDWINEIASNNISPKTAKIIDKYFKEFMEETIEFKGREYSGQAKLDLVNDLNLRGKGSGNQLKNYAAILQYQNKYKLQLPSGAENLAGILPFGAESQLVSGLGTRFFPKSIKDLRAGVRPTIGSRLLEFVTGTKRGELVTLIDGQLVEIQPVRAFPGGRSKKVSPGEQLTQQLIGVSTEPSFISNIFSRRQRTDVRIIRPKSSPPISSYSAAERKFEDILTPYTYTRTGPARKTVPYTMPRDMNRILAPIRSMDRSPQRPIREIRRTTPQRPQPPRPRPPIRDFIVPRPRPPIERVRPSKPQINPLIPRRDTAYRRPLPKRPQRKKPTYKPLPTAFELLVGRGKTRAAKKSYSGFEVFRFI